MDLQGVIFTLLNDCVVDNFGLDVWNQLIDESELVSGGIYTSNQSYSDEELFELVVNLSKKVCLSVDDLVRIYGEYLFPHLIDQMPEAHQSGMSFTDFMLSVDRVIHKEVERIYPDAYLPSIEFIEHGKDITMIYRSKRQLCLLAEGLTIGAAKYFKVDVELEHSVCMHKGDDHCEILIKIK